MKYVFKGFTEKANTAINLSITAAQEMGHTYIGTEHLVLGLLKEGTGVAAAVLGGGFAAYWFLLRKKNAAPIDPFSAEELIPKTKTEIPAEEKTESLKENAEQ